MRPLRFWQGYALHLWQTTVHKLWVAYYMVRYLLSQPGIHGPVAVGEFLRRAVVHDLSKYRFDEARGFAETVFDLKSTPYSSDPDGAYRTLLRRIKPSIKLHYARNSHHPEHYSGGYAEMTAADRAEMLCDWAAAVRRQKDGDLASSIRQNVERFGYDGREALRLGRLATAIGAL